ncbi:hypothetical protein RE433_29000 (plasmid) [Bacillus cereus]|uniref:hypothetical protein n=1 Tax=Bacillus cereus TaxID=1396 RepID=UPI002867C410|nr:hypothetical protein [Bacillus cereus]WMW41378.1 hypothetical protein RE433_29000 [Bacillus cereus]
MTRIYNEVITDEQYLIANRNGISKKNVYQRVNEYGWSIEKAITNLLIIRKIKKQIVI